MSDKATDDYEYEERAAILEYDAGYSREEAERLAREQMKRKPSGDSDKPVSLSAAGRRNPQGDFDRWRWMRGGAMGARWAHNPEIRVRFPAALPMKR